MTRKSFSRPTEPPDPRPPHRPRLRRHAKVESRYCCGYILLNTKLGGQTCEACGDPIKRRQACYWHPVIKSLRCKSCTPTYETFRENEIVVWYVEEGRFEEQEWTDDELAEIEENRRRSEAGVVGVVVFADASLNEDANVVESSGGWRRADDPGDREEVLPFDDLLRKDAGHVRNLTDPNKILTKDTAELLAELEPTIRHWVWDSYKKSAGRFDKADLRAVIHLKLVDAIRKYDGRGSFGAFIDAVVPRALVSYARRELRNDFPKLSLEGDDLVEALSHDPTDEWIAKLDVDAIVAEVPNAGLVLLKEADYRSAELGGAAVTDKRASRARIDLRTRLLDGGYTPSIVATR